MSYRVIGITHERYAEIDEELARIETFLGALAQEVREATAPGDGHNHTWLQVDSAMGYARSLRAALHRDDLSRW